VEHARDRVQVQGVYGSALVGGGRLHHYMESESGSAPVERMAKDFSESLPDAKLYRPRGALGLL